MDPLFQEHVKESYDTVAEDYSERVGGELAHKPFDRGLLDSFANQVKGQGKVADLGCGPGMVSRHLHDKGVSVVGIDISPRMLACAAWLNPGIEFRVGDFSKLEGVPDGSWAGIVAFYALVHVPREQVKPVLREFYRKLRPGGLLLLAFHLGSEVRHASDWWGHPVNLDFVFFETTEMLSYLWDAGFDTDSHIERDPYPDAELQTRRGYILARRPLRALAHDPSPEAIATAHPTTIYRIISSEDWLKAKAAGTFTGTSHDVRDGFIHFSASDQIAETAKKFYAQQTDLLLLYVRTAALLVSGVSTLKWEVSRDGALFPHLYGELPVAAVHRVELLPPGPDGAYQLPELEL
jgi:uncharacterized protein (DUF952 family)/ubiquinone/menaquinone biosynthesis C-methylase UbiE